MPRPLLRVNGREINVRVLGGTRLHVYVAVSDPYAGRRHMYTLWKLRLGGGFDGRRDSSHGEARIIGREIDLPLCRKLVKDER